MNKVTLLGLLLLAASGCILGFQAISSMMTAGEVVWKTMSLVDATSPETLKWVDGLSVQMLQKGLRYIVTMPLYILLGVLGVLMLIVGGFMSK